MVADVDVCVGGMNHPAVVDVDARVDLLCDLITAAKQGDCSPIAAAQAIDRLTPHLTNHLSRLPAVPGGLPPTLAHELDLLTR